MDWPVSRVYKNVISTWSPESLGVAIGTQAGAPASVAWGSANLGKVFPFAIGAPYLVRKVWWANGGVAAGNVDCGVYNLDGTLLFSAGSTAQSGTQNIQSVDITDYLLTPGSYYMALAASLTTTTFYCASFSAVPSRLAGVAQMAAALPLPAAFTFASNSVTSVQLCGITNGTVL